MATVTMTLDQLRAERARYIALLSEMVARGSFDPDAADRLLEAIRSVDADIDRIHERDTDR